MNNTCVVLPLARLEHPHASSVRRYEGAGERLQVAALDEVLNDDPPELRLIVVVEAHAVVVDILRVSELFVDLLLAQEQLGLCFDHSFLVLLRCSFLSL